MRPHSLPISCRIIDRVQESPNIFSLHLKIDDTRQQQKYRFAPGQFNMLHLPAGGEIPISIVSDPEHDDLIKHTIRDVGRITHALSQYRPGDYLGLRGPFGSHWPVQLCKQDQDILVISGGLGCAPVVSIIHYLLTRQTQFSRLFIIQGVKHSDDLIWKKSYQQWQKQQNVEVLLSADKASPNWQWYQGLVTDLIEQADFRADKALAMMCGPEIMMFYAAKALQKKGIKDQQIWLSMERNMQCATGHCGHCQTGSHFVCKQGAVFHYPDIKNLLASKL